jgi:hypothetical protein
MATIEVLLKHGNLTTNDDLLGTNSIRKHLDYSLQPWTYFIHLALGRNRACFNDFVKAGIFELFLRHGADPNSMYMYPRPETGVPPIPRIAWIDIFNALCKYTIPEHFDDYLHVLDAFIESGARFDASTSDESQRSTSEKLLKECFHSTSYCINTSSFPTQLRMSNFLEQLWLRLACMAGKERLSLDVIDFSPSEMRQFRPAYNKIRDQGGSVLQVVKSWRKRPLDSEVEQGPCKRPWKP